MSVKQASRTVHGQSTDSGWSPSDSGAQDSANRGVSDALLCWLRGHHDARRPRLLSSGFCPKCGCPVGRDEDES